MTQKTIKEVLRTLMEAHEISENELARRTSLNQPNIHRLLSGVTADPRGSTLMALSSYFNVSIEELLGQKELLPTFKEASEQNIGAEPIKNVRYAPLLSWQEAITVCLEKATPPYKITRRPVFSNAGHRSFWIQMQGNSMYPVLSDKKSFLCVDPEREPNDISLCLVYQKETQELMVRQLLMDGSLKIVKTVNPDYPFKERLDDRFIFCGVVTEDQKDHSAH